MHWTRRRTSREEGQGAVPGTLGDEPAAEHELKIFIAHPLVFNHLHELFWPTSTYQHQGKDTSWGKARTCAVRVTPSVCVITR